MKVLVKVGKCISTSNEKHKEKSNYKPLGWCTEPSKPAKMLLAGKLNELTSVEKKINKPEVKLDAVNAAMLNLGNKGSSINDVRILSKQGFAKLGHFGT